MAARIPVVLELDGGRTVEVVADQRDMRRAEETMGRRGLSTTDYPVTFARCLGWAAAHRTGQTTDKWDDFDLVLVEATADSPEPVDPTPPVPSDG